MGLTNSKVGKQLDNEVPQEASIPSVPILTPTAIRKNELDPRSPSANIARTPLEILTAAADKLEGLYEENVTPVKNSAYILADDPRSPTTEFKRTPIIINDKEDLLKKLHNKNLEKRLQSDVDPRNGNSKRNIVPPKLLESSPIKPKPDANKRKSFVGLLETNIDYTETDIDVVFQEKCKVTSETPKNIAIVQTEDIDPRSPTTEFLRTPIQIARKIGEIQLNSEESFNDRSEEQLEDDNYVITNIITKIVDEIASEYKMPPDEVKLDVKQQLTTNGDLLLYDSSKILAREIIQPNPIETEYETVTLIKATGSERELFKSAPVTPPQIKNISTKVSSEKQIKSAPISPQVMHPKPIETEYEKVALIEARELIKSAPVTPPQIKNIPAKVSLMKQIKSAPISPQVNVQELDKKLTDLIYEDADLVVCPRPVTLKEYDMRSPLQNWNRDIGHKRPSKLKVSDKPRKSDHGAISKIPVFKDKAKQNVQCENTPPRSVEKKKTKPKPQPCLWDPDNTLYL